MSKQQTTRKELIPGKGGKFAVVTHASAAEAARATEEEREIQRALERANKRGTSQGKK